MTRDGTIFNMLRFVSPSELPRLRPGDRVRVKSRETILATLDANGCLDRLPFMPEMLAHCGKTFRVRKIAHKTCDTIRNSGGRALDRTVHLEGDRCSGAAHGGCEAGCSLFWKEAWLEPAGVESAVAVSAPATSEPTLDAFARGAEPDRWRCQTTELLAATRPLLWWDVRQYVADVATGNRRAREVLGLIAFAGFRNLVGLGWGYRLLVGTFDWIQQRRGRPRYPDRPGSIMRGRETPTATLDLKPGELVRVKPHEEILATLNVDGMNRGMRFDAEMAKYCGKSYRVAGRINRILDEKTGRMLVMKSPCIQLEDVYCRAQCTSKRLGCPREVNTYWREIWLTRVEPSAPAAPRTPEAAG